MNYNEVMQLAQQELQKRAKQMPDAQPTAKDIQQAEMAMQVLGHPAWDSLAAHLQEQLATTQGDLGRLKDNWSTSFADPLRDGVMHQNCAALIARIKTLKEVLDYLPSLVKKVQHAPE